jgi:hypothetical protein
MIQLSELYAREKNGDVQYMFFIKVPSKLRLYADMSGVG